jgi:hypothetical protein
MENKKAILIDPGTKEVKQIDIEPSIKCLESVLNTDVLDMQLTKLAGNFVYFPASASDYRQDRARGFKIAGCEPIYGKAIVFGSMADPVPTVEVETLMANLKFY